MSSFPVQYRSTIANNSLGIVEGPLVFFEKISITANQICRIVVPIYLRRIFFSLLHASSTAGHMGKYKTLHRIRLRFFWPRIRSDINQCDVKNSCSPGL